MIRNLAHRRSTALDLTDEAAVRLGVLAPCLYATWIAEARCRAGGHPLGPDEQATLDRLTTLTLEAAEDLSAGLRELARLGLVLAGDAILTRVDTAIWDRCGAPDGGIGAGGEREPDAPTCEGLMQRAAEVRRKAV